MATRICILFPRPGRLGLILENKLPYPRDAKSPEFQRLVDSIHETITTLTRPDQPPEPPPAAGQPVSRARRRMIAWGRYAGIMDYNPNSKTVFVPHDEENATK